MIYDIIGDVHGYSIALQALLSRLGYVRRGAVYIHNDQNRKALFVGDIVDRGPDIPESLEIVRNMVDAGSAEMVLGNHEYNLIAYTTRDRTDRNRYLRNHSHVHERQCRETFKQFSGSRKILDEYLLWFMHLPLFIELPELRLVHAAWHPESITEIRRQSPGRNSLTEDILQQSSHFGTPAFFAVEYSLKGMEIQLPKGMTYQDKEGSSRSRSRTAWWYAKSSAEIHSLYDLVFPKGIVPETLSRQTFLDSADIDHIPGYTGDRPVFVGHYWLTGTAESISPSIACVDYSIAAGGSLTAYSYECRSGLPTELSNSCFTQVDANGNLQ